MRDVGGARVGLVGGCKTQAKASCDDLLAGGRLGEREKATAFDFNAWGENVCAAGKGCACLWRGDCTNNKRHSGVREKSRGVWVCCSSR